MSERTKSIRHWGGRVGRTAGNLAMAGGIGVAVWGGAQIVDSLFVNTPNFNESPTRSSTDASYLAAREADAQQFAEGLGAITSGVPIALAGFALNTVLYRPEPEQPVVIENLSIA